jgi:hypothetical protein
VRLQDKEHKKSEDMEWGHIDPQGDRHLAMTAFKKLPATAKLCDSHTTVNLASGVLQVTNSGAWMRGSGL